MRMTRNILAALLAIAPGAGLAADEPLHAHAIIAKLRDAAAWRASPYL